MYLNQWKEGLLLDLEGGNEGIASRGKVQDSLSHFRYISSKEGGGRCMPKMKRAAVDSQRKCGEWNSARDSYSDLDSLCSNSGRTQEENPLDCPGQAKSRAFMDQKSSFSLLSLGKSSGTSLKKHRRSKKMGNRKKSDGKLFFLLAGREKESVLKREVRSLSVIPE